VRDRENLGAKSEGEQQFGRMRDEADDAHDRDCTRAAAALVSRLR
jgi:hypothetical protein